MIDISGFLVVILIGIVVIVLSYLLDHIWAAAAPARIVYLFIRAPGVVVHECSHILGCLVTGARIQNIVLLSREGGSVTYKKPLIPYIGDVIISTAPLFLIPLFLSLVTGIFGTYLGCTFPEFPATIDSKETFLALLGAIGAMFSLNLVASFNGWFLLYLYLAVSLVLSVAPSAQDVKNAAVGIVLITLAGIMIVWSDISVLNYLLGECMHLLEIGFTLGLVYGLIVLAFSLPLVIWYAWQKRDAVF